MENDRGSWGSTFGFIMAAVGSAVGLGNIWGFPYKMGKMRRLCVPAHLPCRSQYFVGMIIMCSELALGRKTGKGVIAAYQAVSKKFGMARLARRSSSPFLIMSFYSVLGGYCIQYTALNMAELSFDLSNSLGGTAGGGTQYSRRCVKAPFGCCSVHGAVPRHLHGHRQGRHRKRHREVQQESVCRRCSSCSLSLSSRALSLPGSAEGLKFMFVPGYGGSGGIYRKEPRLYRNSRYRRRSDVLLPVACNGRNGHLRLLS